MTLVESGAPAVLADRLSAEQQPQKAFTWNREKWESIVVDIPDAEEVLRTLPDELDRNVVREVVQDNLVRERVLGALVPVLIWGGPGGYGPYRASRILRNGTGRVGRATEDAVRERLIKASEVVRDGDAAEAFRYLNNEGKIKFLGPAFFTKWLAFSSMSDAIDGKGVAPILDKRVRDWMLHNTNGDEQVKLRTTPRTEDYERYLDLLETWGTPYGRTRAQVELAIFDLTRDRPSG